MHHHYKRLLAMVAMIVCCIPAFSELRSIYTFGSHNDFPAPVTRNDSLFEKSKLVETAEGSNIYEGTIQAPNYDTWYIRFYTQLAELKEGDNDWKYVSEHVIAPVGFQYDESLNTIKQIGHSGVFCADVLNSDYLNHSPQTFNIEGLAQENVTLRVDLNTNKFYAWNNDGNNIVVFGNEAVPTLETIDSYVGSNAGIVYVPECDFRYRYYNLGKQVFIGNEGGDNYVIEKFNKRVVLSPEEGSAGFFTVKDWTGGTVCFNSYKGRRFSANVTVNPDEPRASKVDPYLTDQIYLVGDHSGWAFEDANKFLPDATNPYLFKCTLPAGSQGFKITTAADWGVNFGKLEGSAKKNDDGTISVGLERDAVNNLSLTQVSDEDIEIVVDLEKMTVTFPAGTPIQIDQSTSTDPIDYSDVMVLRLDDDLFEPWANASDVVMKNFNYVKPESDGTYIFSVYVPRNEFRLRFISELAPKGSKNKLLVPGDKDREIVYGNDGKGYSRAVETTDTEAGYWNVKDWKGGYVTVTVTPGDNPSVKFDFGDQNSGWYLVGTPTGWAAPNMLNADLYKNWQLTPCQEGMYGEFDIEAGSQGTIFRFYKALDGWEASSVGSQYDDSEIDCTFGDSFVGDMVIGGKGSWSFTDWTGGKMYILINTRNNEVQMSKTPLPHTPIEGEAEGLWIEDRGELSKMREVADGVYCDYAISTDNLRIFTRKLPISPQEPEWACSYILSAPEANYVPKYDRFNVAEFNYTISEEVTTTAPNHIVLEPRETGEALPYLVTVDTNTKTIYLERALGRNLYVTGTLTEGKTPTLRTRADFGDYYINEWKEGGCFVTLPAGKNEIVFSGTAGLGWENSYTREYKTVDLDLSDGFAYGVIHDINYCFCGVRSIINDWKGGKLYVSPTRMLTADSMDEINWSYYDKNGEEQHCSLTRTDKNSLVYKGRVTLPAYGPAANCVIPNPAFDTGNRNDSIPPYKLLIGIENQYAFTYEHVQPENRFYFEGNDVTINTGFNSLYGFTFPQILEEREMDVTLDLVANTLTGKLIGEPEKNVPAISSGNPDMEDKLNPSAVEKNVYTATIPNVKEGENSFNILDGSGNVIVPTTGNTEIEFDEFGSYTGSYTVLNPPAGKRARAVARTSAQWTFNNPAEGGIAIAVNENSKTVTLHSSSACKNYFIIASTVPYWVAEPRIENLEDMKKNVLFAINDGTYSAKMNVYANTQTMVFTRSPFDNRYNGIAPRYQAIADLSEANAAIVVPTEYEGQNTGMWTITGVKKESELSIVYDPEAMTMTFNRVPSGVDEISGDNSNLRVNAVRGMILIDSPADAEISIFNLQGMAVKTVNVNAGRTTVNLAPGLYIVAGRKLVVR